MRGAPDCAASQGFASEAALDADIEAAAIAGQEGSLVGGALADLSVDSGDVLTGGRAVTHDAKIYDRFDRLFHLRDGRLEDQEGSKV